MCAQLFDPKVDYIFLPKIICINVLDFNLLEEPNNEKIVELEMKYDALHEAKVELARLQGMRKGEKNKVIKIGIIYEMKMYKNILINQI